MRSLSSALFGPEIAPSLRNRPELLRRATLAVNGRMLAAASALATPAALYLLIQGQLLPFLLAMTGLAAGMLTLSMHQRGHYERAAAGQVYATLLAGSILTAADPAIVDFGLAVALLGPVYASLLTRSPVKKRAWAILVAVVVTGALVAAGLIRWPEQFHASYAASAIIAFAIVGLIVAYTANRLNSAFEVYERAQINAYRHLIENVQDAVMRFGADGAVLFTSKSAEQLFGCPRYQLSGQGLIERLHLLDRPAFMTAFAEANQDGRARTVEVRTRRDDPAMPMRAPSFFWLEIALTPVVDDKEGPGARHEVVALLRDVTTRREQDQKCATRGARRRMPQRQVALPRHHRP